MRYDYCPKCGEKLTHRDLGDEKNVPWCEKCDRPWFDTFQTCIIAVARRNGKYALTRQRSHEKGFNEERYILVSGYITVCESAEDAAMREINEELGLKALSCRFISSYVYEKKEMLMLGFLVDVDEGEFSISVEVKEAEWFDMDTALEKLKDASIARQLLADILETEK